MHMYEPKTHAHLDTFQDANAVLEAGRGNRQSHWRMPCTFQIADLRCSFLPGVSVCAWRRGRYGDGWGSGMDKTSWVWSGYQWGLSSSKAVSNSIRICAGHKPQQELSLLLLTSTTDLGGLYEPAPVSIFQSANVFWHRIDARQALCQRSTDVRATSQILTTWKNYFWP